MHMERIQHGFFCFCVMLGIDYMILGFAQCMKTIENNIMLKMFQVIMALIVALGLEFRVQ